MRVSKFKVANDGTFTTLKCGTLFVGNSGIFITNILNENNMISDSPFALATQSSIKAYVDSIAGSGDVVGPASSTDNAITRYNGITGKLIKNSSLLLNDNIDLIFQKPTNTLTISVTDQTVSPSTATIIDLQGISDDFLFATANQDATLHNLVVNNDLTVFGTTTTFDVQTVLIGNNSIILNFGYMTPVAKGSALVSNFLPTATSDTVGVGGFTAGVGSVSNPTVITTGTATFSTSDLIQISNTDNINNSGIYEVLSHVGTTLTVRGIGLTDTVELWTSRQFVTDPIATGDILKINVAVIETDTSGIVELAIGSVTPLNYSPVLTDTNTATLTNKTITDSSNSVTAKFLATTGTDVTINTNAPTTSGQLLITTSTTNATWQTIAFGDVTGPAGSTANAITRFNGVTGKIIKNSGVILDDSDNITGIVSLTATNLTGTIQTASQPNITSLGTLTSLIVSGNLTFDRATNDLNITVADQTVGLSTANIPDLGGTTQDFIFTNQSQTLTNKTMSTGSIWNGNIISPTFGGTGLSDPTVDNVLITNGAGNMTLKTSPTGDFVGTTDSQILTNKTITDSSNSVTAKFLATTGTDVTINTNAPTTSGQLLVTTSTTNATWQTIAFGDVTGPAGSTANAITRFNGVTGKIIKNSGVILDDSDNITGITSLTATNLTGTIQTASQPNITSVGTLTSLTIAGDLLFDRATNDLNITVADQTGATSTANIPNLGGIVQDFIFTNQSQVLSNKTISSPIFTGNFTVDLPTNDLIITFTDQTTGISTVNVPNLNGTTQDFVFTSQSQTLTNKTMNSGSIWNGNTISSTFGGTGLSAPTIGNVLITNGAGNMTLKTSPSGDFVGTTDSQVLTNKTITSSTNSVTAKFLATTGTDVTINTNAPSTTGQALVTTSTTNATWQTVNTTVVGNNYQSATVSARTTTISTTFQVKTTLTTPALTGTYRVGWHAVLDMGAGNQSGEVRLQNTTDATTIGATQNFRPSANTVIQGMNGFLEVVFAGVAKTFQIQFRSVTAGQTTGIQDAVIEFWRVS